MPDGAPGDPRSRCRPRIKFRWCRTVPCGLAHVKLFLTSVTSTQIDLNWYDDLGWYESDLVELPVGLHSAFIHIERKVNKEICALLPVRTSAQEDYKVEPFYVSPHKAAIELFLATDRAQPFWVEAPTLRQRYLSSQSVHECSKGATGRPYHSNDELNLRPDGRQCMTVDYNNSRVESRLQDSRIRNGIHDENIKDERVGISQFSSSGLGPDEEFDVSQVEADLSQKASLRKCSSAEPARDPTPDSSYHSRSQSFQQEDCISFPYLMTSGDDGGILVSESKNRDLEKSPSCENLHGKSEVDNVPVEQPSLKDIYPECSLDNSGKDYCSLVGEFFSHLRLSDAGLDSASNGDSPEKRYGCVITFESRSPSMDDLGSPRALEEVLVSMASSEADCHGNSPHYIQTQSGLLKSHSTDMSSSVENCAKNTAPFSENKPEMMATKNSLLVGYSDEEDFQYDSLKHEDEHIPLNIKHLDSEESLEIKAEERSGIASQDDKPIKTRPEEYSSTEGDELFLENFADTADTIKMAGSYRLLETPGCLSSENKEKTATPVCRKEVEVSMEPYKTLKNYSTPSAQRNAYDNGYEAGVSENDRSLSDHFEDFVPKVMMSSGALPPKYSTNLKPKENSVEFSQRVHSSVSHHSSLRHRVAKSYHDTEKHSHRNVSVSDRTKSNVQFKPVSISGREVSPLSDVSRRHHQHSESFQTLPDKPAGPWSNNDVVSTTSTGNSKRSLTTLQQNLYNLVKAEKILKSVYHAHSANRPDVQAENSFRIRECRRRLYNNSGMPVKGSTPVRTIPPPHGGRESDVYVRPDQLTYGLSNYGETRSYKSEGKSDYGETRSCRFEGKSDFSQYLVSLADERRNFLASRSTRRSSLRKPEFPQSNSGQLRTSLSLPDMRVLWPSKRTQSNYYVRRHGLAYLSRPWLDDSSSLPRETKARRPFRDACDESSGDSTDALIDEADRAVAQRFDIFGDYSYSDEPSSVTNPSPFHRPRRGSGPLETTPKTGRYPRVAGRSSERYSRTRSDSDSKLTKPRAEAPLPYLPYCLEELSLGQMLKVLVPGGGVAVGKVVCTSGSRRYLRIPEVTVLLMSEPNRLAGTVLSVPIEKVLLAWPK